jgi:diapolycopene oxygenase
MIVVIGAGIGGLSAAIALAARGRKVTVLEQLDRPGGKMGEHVQAGFRWDTGPSVITMRDVFERLFALAGRRLEDYVDLVPLHPVTRYFWRDGLVFDAVLSEADMRKQIGAFSPPDAENYSQFMRYAAKLFDTVKEPFLYSRKPGLRDLTRLPLRDALKIDALRTMAQSTSATFRDKRLVQLFNRFATYNGSSPYKVPATLNTIAHVELAAGAFYPRGGVYQIAKAYEKLARELGVDIRYNTPVRRITTRRGHVTGVQIGGNTVGEISLSADAVVCNADYTQSRMRLLDAGGSNKLEPSCSGFVLMMGVRGTSARLAHHNIFFCDDYPREFNDIFTRKVAAEDPTLYACITSKTDPAHAPPGCENWFVLVNAPYLSGAYDWHLHAAGYAAHIKRMLARQAGLDPRQIVVEKIITPADLQQRYGGNRGAIYGFSSNSMSAAFQRPDNRDHKLRGLYYASGSAHPGGGVPLVTLSGMAAAGCVLDDFK